MRCDRQGRDVKEMNYSPKRSPVNAKILGRAYCCLSNSVYDEFGLSD